MARNIIRKLQMVALVLVCRSVGQWYELSTTSSFSFLENNTSPTNVCLPFIRQVLHLFKEPKINKISQEQNLISGQKS